MIKTKVYYLKDQYNKIRYIGITTKSLKERYDEHIRDCKYNNKNSHKVKWLRKCIKYNKLPTIHLIIEIGEYAYELEQILIEIARKNNIKLVNGCDGGKGSLGHICSKETKQKLRLINLGKKHTPEAIKKISEASKRNPPSLKCRQKANEAIRGKKKSREHLIKLSQSKGSKPFYCIETNKKYILLADASNDTKTSQSKVCACLKGRRKSAGGYHFKYIDQNEQPTQSGATAKRN
jgi:hypothetical protein